MTTTTALSTIPTSVYSWGNWNNWSDYNPDCFSNSAPNYPLRQRTRACNGLDLNNQHPKLCGDLSDKVEFEIQEPRKNCSKSIFNNTKRSLMETKIKLPFLMQISEQWSDDLTNTNSAHFEYLSQLYATAILIPLKNVRRTGDLSDSTTLSSLHSSWKILFYSVRVKSFSKVTQSILSGSSVLIEALFETIFDVLADADEDNDSKLTWNAQKELIKGLTTDIKEEIDEKRSVSDTSEGDYTKFVSDVNFQEAELDDVFLQVCDSNYVNMENSCEKTCALTPCQDSQIFSDFLR